jgi:hypothetical protein
MAITLKRSTDVGAPALTNTAGSLITLLDYLLVTTLGWTKTVLATNVAKYTQPAGSNGFSLQVKDTATTSSQLCGFETLTATDTGTGQFPTVAQAANNIYIDKAATTTWRFLSNGKMFYLFVKTSTAISSFGFGDFITYKTGDAFHTAIIGNTASATAQQQFNVVQGSSATVVSGNFIARSYTQVGTSITAGKITDSARILNGVMCGIGGMTYPSPVDGGLNMAPLWITETSTGIGARGLVPGIWCPLHNRPLVDGDTFSVSAGALAGRSFEVVDAGFSTASYGQIFIETSDTWGGF